MRSIKLYWSGGNGKFFNFGDALSPLIVEMMTRRTVRFSSVKRCDMLAIGSIIRTAVGARWQRLLRGRFSPIKVWGSGSLGPNGLFPSWQLKYLAVRGALTRDALQLPIDTPLGDPGLLVNRLMDGRIVEKKDRWGLVPHMCDSKDPIAQQIIQENRGTKMIDLTDPDPVRVARSIAGCHFIISTSLHGLITADSFGIPNLRLILSNRVIGADWKFGDYASSVGRIDLDAVNPTEALNLRSLESRASRASSKAISEVCVKLENVLAEIGLS